MAVATVQKSPAAKPVRKDPPQRSLDPEDAWVQLENKDPDLSYVWVSKNSPSVGVNRYRARGYKVVRYEPGGVRPVGDEDLQPGEIVEYLDTVLMAIPLEQKLAIEQAGQKHADDIELRFKRRGRSDEVTKSLAGNRAPTGDLYVYEVNETSGEFRGV